MNIDELSPGDILIYHGTAYWKEVILIVLSPLDEERVTVLLGNGRGGTFSIYGVASTHNPAGRTRHWSRSNWKRM